MKVWRNTKLFLALLVFAFFTFAFFASAQEKKEPQATVTQEFFKAPQKFDKVDRNKNKILDHLEERIKPAKPEERFDVIVMAEKPPSEILPNLKSRHGDFSEKFTYPSINGFATNLNKGQILAFADDTDIRQIEFDAPVYLHLNTAQQWFGTTKARDDFGLDGNTDGSPSYSENDIVVAVLDTGIDYNHVDLDGGKVIGQKCYCCSRLNPQGCIKPCCPNDQEEDDNALDDHGHGTHVSSIACGEGEGNANYKGVAPGAALVGVKVLDSKGGGYMSYVNAGIQWVIENKDTLGIEVMNISVGAAGNSDGTDSTSQLVNSAVVDAGIVAVVSAGNEGPGKYTIGSPAAAAEAITVGAMADVYPGPAGSFTCGQAPGYGFYQICFSSRGPTADGRIKPEISSPGVFIQAAAMGTGNGYTEKSGTSMSSPFTAGLAALMLHANSALTPADIKTKIMDTALDWGPTGDDIDYGAGRLDGYEAIESAGGYSGTNIATPEHQDLAGSLAGTGDEDLYDINIADISYPIAVTLIMPDWASSSDPDFDLYLYDTDGTTELDRSIGTNRQETIGYQPDATGTYKLRVYSYAGSGDYFFDQSAGIGVVVSISLTDGLVEFGILALGEVATSSGDVQTVLVETGPADLEVKTTLFSDGTYFWSLGTTSEVDLAVWEFSPDLSVWTIFETADALYPLASGVADEGTQDIYFRLTMPTETLLGNQYSTTVTIVATSP